VAAPFANAFALPGGFVFITKPLLDLCNHDRNEIAFFLGHEIAHIL
jgi:Zn-dependent protease with chaperone function